MVDVHCFPHASASVNLGMPREGIELDVSTLADWLRAGAAGSRREALAGEKGRRDLRAALGRACWWLTPLYELPLSTALSSAKLVADDTTLPVLDPGRGKTKTGRLWCYTVDDRPWAGQAI